MICSNFFKKRKEKEKDFSWTKGQGLLDLVETN